MGRWKGNFGTPQTESGEWISANGLIAGYFGWCDAWLGPWPGTYGFSDWGTFFQDGPVKGQRVYGGIDMRICMSPNKCGHPAGLTFRFLVGKTVNLRHLAWLASITKQDWQWMTTTGGERVSRARWLRLYNPALYDGPPGRKGALAAGHSLAP
jgi:hypothetical protein